MDLRNGAGSRRASDLLAELTREVPPGHPLCGLERQVIAEALPQEEVVVQAGERVALVHLTWSGRRKLPPWPTAVFVESAAAFEELVQYRY